MATRLFLNPPLSVALLQTKQFMQRVFRVKTQSGIQEEERGAPEVHQNFPKPHAISKGHLAHSPNLWRGLHQQPDTVNTSPGSGVVQGQGASGWSVQGCHVRIAGGVVGWVEVRVAAT